jgi:hypothetical protein
VTDSNKHSSLLRREINDDGRKKFHLNDLVKTFFQLSRHSPKLALKKAKSPDCIIQREVRKMCPVSIRLSHPSAYKQG